MEKLIDEYRLDKSHFSVTELGDESDDIAYWHSRTPEERLRAMELMRQINYGYDPTERLQRVLEFAELGES